MGHVQLWPTLPPGSGDVSFDSLAPLLSAVEQVGFPPSRQVPGPQHLQGRPYPTHLYIVPTEGGPVIGAPGSWELGPWVASVEAPHACSFRTHVDLGQFQAQLVDLVLGLPVPEGHGHLSADWRHHSLPAGCPA